MNSHCPVLTFLRVLVLVRGHGSPRGPVRRIGAGGNRHYLAQALDCRLEEGGVSGQIKQDAWRLDVGIEPPKHQVDGLWLALQGKSPTA